MAYRLPRYRVALVREGCSHSNMNHIHEPEDVYKIIAVEYAAAVVETAMMLALDTKNKVIGIFEISRGSLNASIIHPRDVFQRALLVNAASVILVHNHPSGDPTPSPEDVKLTKKLVEAGRVMDITVLDHVICGEGKYVSLRERGQL
ncbi:MAG: DNA repair protein RadC [Veillonellaceae bacterium]|nr:DNA repair protein RadC [Veillonellaceae bacterium]